MFPWTGDVIPVSPLTPGDDYIATVDWQGAGATYTRTFTFQTALQQPNLNVGADKDGGAGIAVASDSPAVAKPTLTGRGGGNRIVWRAFARPGALRNPRWRPLPPTVRGTYNLCAPQAATAHFAQRERAPGWSV
jgi:hypothetical protein